MEELHKQILSNKLDSYSVNKDDFKAFNELTVEITLEEYRKLISEVATKKQDIDKAEKDKYTRESDNKNLKEKVSILETELLKYKVKYGELEEENKQENLEE